MPFNLVHLKVKTCQPAPGLFLSIKRILAKFPSHDRNYYKDHSISQIIRVYHWTMHTLTLNKCIEDDMKAAARQSLNCIRTKKNKIWRKTIFNMADEILTPCNVARSWHWFRKATAPCNVTCGFGIVTVNSPRGSNLQCDTWLWDDMPINSRGGSTLQWNT